MKKKYIVLLSFLAVITIAGLWGYQHYFNREVSVQEIHVEADFFDFSAAISLDQKETTTTTTPDVTTAAQPEQAASSQNISKKENASTPLQPPSSSDNGPIKTLAPITEETIKQKYYPRFEKLQNLANSRLDQLVNNARIEYKQSKMNGITSVSELASKYTSAANKLQGAVDQAFYQLLDQMKSELNQAGLPLNLANQAEQAYETKSKQKKAEIMQKASKVL